jgi:hypothetical protein
MLRHTMSCRGFASATFLAIHAIIARRVAMIVGHNDL